MARIENNKYSIEEAFCDCFYTISISDSVHWSFWMSSIIAL